MRMEVQAKKDWVGMQSLKWLLEYKCYSNIISQFGPRWTAHISTILEQKEEVCPTAREILWIPNGNSISPFLEFVLGLNVQPRK